MDLFFLTADKDLFLMDLSSQDLWQNDIYIFTGLV